MVEAFARVTARRAPAASAHSDSFKGDVQGCHQLFVVLSRYAPEWLACHVEKPFIVLRPIPARLRDGAISRSQLAQWVNGRSALWPNCDFARFGCLQTGYENKYSVAADRVAVAVELDKFGLNMNNPTEPLSDRRNRLDSRERQPTLQQQVSSRRRRAEFAADRSRSVPSSSYGARSPEYGALLVG